MTARTRFAPSPTGMLHVGGARTALFCYLEARRQGGEYLLRIEDTDRERSTKEAVQVILDGLSWLGLDHDEGPFYQTLRFDRYREVAEQLMRSGKAYRCWCSRERLDAMREQQMAEGIKPRYDGLCRDRSEGVEGVTPVIRFRNPDSGEVVLDDRVRGRIVFNNEELDDLIIWRSDDTPTYNFCVVVDDVDMKITEVIRGDDHVNNTPRQINIYKALGAPLPVFAHVPMILGADGAKLSKRHGAVSVLQYREDGYLPQALLNYLVRLGWSHGDQEIFSMQEMIALFDIANVNKAASRFDYDKLAWLNQHYMKTLDPAEVAPHLVYQLKAAGLDPALGPDPADVVRAMADRVKTLKEMAERARVWYAPLDGFEEGAASKFLNAAAQAPLAAVRERLAALDRWTVESVHAALAEAAQALELGLGKVAQPMRVAATGTAVSPSIDHTIYLVGQARMLDRIDAALAEIARRTAA